MNGTLYAVSVEDARNAARAYVRLIQERHATAIRELRKAVQDMSQGAAAENQRFTVLDNAVTTRPVATR